MALEVSSLPLSLTIMRGQPRLSTMLSNSRVGEATADPLKLHVEVLENVTAPYPTPFWRAE